LIKALYGLKLGPKVLYDKLSSFLIENGFSRRQIDTTLFTKTNQFDILIVQVCVDNIFFGSTNKKMCKDFLNLMQNEFEISMMDELRYFFWIGNQAIF